MSDTQLAFDFSQVNHKEPGVIEFTLESEGERPEHWINRFQVREQDKAVLNSHAFSPNLQEKYHCTVLAKPAWTGDRFKHVLQGGDERGLLFHKKPLNPAVTCLVRSRFSDSNLRKLKLKRIVVLHEPVEDAKGEPVMLAAERSSYFEKRFVRGFAYKSSTHCYAQTGFLFLKQ